MLQITHTTPNRLLSHLRKLQRDGEDLLAQSRWLTAREEFPWEVRVWRCLDKIAGPHAFDSAVARDKEDVGEIDPLDFDQAPPREWEGDEIVRRRITRRLGTLASVIEKVEAYAALRSNRSRKGS